MATATDATVSLKLLIDSKGQRVLFAEAGKDFVDFLFNILLLPVGNVIRLLRKQGMVGCLGNLYQSVENLAMSSITIITILNKFNVKQVDALEEKIVDVSMDEGVELLKASMQSKTVLTDVSLSQKAMKECSK
ncbi:putative 60S ribosomal protein L23a [Hibiscus syriacus]|uniref:60S ribosomal protein L23a n=1 Tax=Hibiscus syriacus TaxID=106335 RepID=A0A6A2XHG4_HIBSY|nr:putative 60S ribosomal protein L23a [Hibiscus syriacus]